MPKPKKIVKAKSLKEAFPSGVLPDTRTKAEKDKEFKTEELYGATLPLVWRTWEQWSVDPVNVKMLATFEIQNQDSSYSCMAQAGSLICGINNYKEEKIYGRMSAHSIYPFRRGNPVQGMWTDDLGDILCKRGVIFEALFPSEAKDEAGMNDLTGFLPSFAVLAKIYKSGAYFWINRNVDEVAGIVAQDRPVLITVLFGDGEWSQQVPKIIDGNSLKYGHGIVILPNAYFTLNGKKAVLIQDSWGVDSGIKGRRIVTEDWFTKNRVTSAIWLSDINNLAVDNPTLEKPAFTFTKLLSLNMQNTDVAMLQKCLGYLKDAQGWLFPLTQSPTGYYGGITRSAVKRFQALKGLTQSGNVDAQTLVALNLEF